MSSISSPSFFDQIMSFFFGYPLSNSQKTQEESQEKIKPIVKSKAIKLVCPLTKEMMMIPESSWDACPPSLFQFIYLYGGQKAQQGGLLINYSVVTTKIHKFQSLLEPTKSGSKQKNEKVQTLIIDLEYLAKRCFQVERSLVGNRDFFSSSSSSQALALRPVTWISSTKNGEVIRKLVKKCLTSELLCIVHQIEQDQLTAEGAEEKSQRVFEYLRPTLKMVVISEKT